jgi:hypothetical protein
VRPILRTIGVIIAEERARQAKVNAELVARIAAVGE